VSGPSGHGWWAMMIALVVAAMVLILAAFSYVFLWSRNPAIWSPPPAQATLLGGLALNAAAAVLAFISARLARRTLRSARLAVWLMVAAGVVLAGAWLLDLSSWRASDLRAQASAHGAMVYTFLAWQSLFVAVALLMGVYIVLRRLFGLIAPERPTTSDLISLFLIYSAGQGAFSMLLTRLFPGA